MPYNQKDVIVPVINMNGTSADDLFNSIKNAYDMARNLATALAAMNPHGRDYQTEPRGVYERARDQHRTRRVEVDRIERELAIIMLAVHEQREERRR